MVLGVSFVIPLMMVNGFGIAKIAFVCQQKITINWLSELIIVDGVHIMAKVSSEII